MRLYLASFRLGNQPQRLSALAPGNRRALVIANACDLFAEAERAPRVDREIAALDGLGFRAEELDLRQYFPGQGARTDLPERLAACGLVWARGGNAFLLLRAMRQSGFAPLILDALARDTVVYGGYSGGIAVLAPSLRGIELVNAADTVPAGYDPGIPWEGLGVVPYSLAPHYKSAHPASPGIDRVVGYFLDHAMPFRVLRDGEAVCLSGDGEELLR